ncbi:MAG TPA: HAMP domain-containing sensor histidine kinase [Candidatus Dormibacteraeota bacterium]|nr:HAMP domain-containing sensor histidine kinase [Candidatus Dormibacteraeota bacterium]
MLATTKKPQSPFGTLIRFGLLALVPVIALGILLAYELSVDVQQRYLDSSQTSAILITQVGIQPLLTPAQLGNGLSNDEIIQIDEKLQGAASSQAVVRLKIYNNGGTIVYSNNHLLIGQTYGIDGDLRNALNGTSTASITNGRDSDETGDVPLPGPLIQVYVPLTFAGSPTPSGAFEIYLPYAPVQASIDRETRQLYVFLVGGLILLYASMFPVVLLADRSRRRAEMTVLENLAMLERLNRLKSEFLVRIAHEFRTALVGIEGFSEVIEYADRLDLDEVKLFAREINSDAQRLDRAFDAMVELDEMQAGRAELHFSKVDLNELATQALVAAGGKNGEHKVVMQLDQSAPPVPCDRDRVYQVLRNLIGNAMRYSRPGTEVVIASEARADSVVVSVTDQGPGMPAGFDAKNFVGRPNGESGPGLGLPIARQIVEMHGGRIWFESATGQGSAFHFSLPIKVAPAQPASALTR